MTLLSLSYLLTNSFPFNGQQYSDLICLFDIDNFIKILTNLYNINLAVLISHVAGIINRAALS